MVAVKYLKVEIVRFDSQSFDFERFVSEAENEKISAERRNLNFVAEYFDMTVVVAYMNFGSDSANEVADILVEVLWFLDCYLWSGHYNFAFYYLLKILIFGGGYMKKNPSGAVVFGFSELKKRLSVS